MCQQHAAPLEGVDQFAPVLAHHIATHHLRAVIGGRWVAVKSDRQVYIKRIGALKTRYRPS
jgi:hypothetical protein